MKLARRTAKGLLYYAKHPQFAIAREAVASTVDGTKFHCMHENMIERCIAEDGEWEPYETALVRKHVKTDDIVFDVGANIGYFTLLMSKLVGPGGQVHAFEPTQYGFDRMCKNLTVNPSLPKNTRMRNMGLLSKPVVREEALEARFSLRVPAHAKDELITFTTVDEYRASEGLDRIDFMKIDVDGHDVEVIRGSEKTLRELKPRLMVEVCQRVLAPLGENADDYLELLIGLGYSACVIAHTGAETTLKELQGDADLHAGSWNLFLEPN